MLLAEYDRLVATHADEPTLAEMRDAIDHAAGQRDAYVSRLYWYTDLEQAKAEAQRTKRPILSLRLLGHLDDELSCANSRLFRLVLYANEHVSQFLRDTYVLHWSSERPAPAVTLDFGDGRVVKRTITGNSVHYVLDSHGRVVDALPGLYGPAAFEHGLAASLELARRSATLTDEDSAKAIATYHLHAEWALSASWRKLLRAAYPGYESYVDAATLPAPVRFSWPSPLYSSLPASAVNELTVSKADMEAPTLSLFQPEVQVSGSWGDWSKVAAPVPNEHVDERSRALIESKHPRDWSSKDAAIIEESKLGKRFSAFETRMTEEALRNEYVFHGAVHVRMSKPAKLDFDSINDFVYSRVFMTPKSDAWLGLVPTEAFTGIEGDGLTHHS